MTGARYDTRLEALRGVAALTVAAFHVGQTQVQTPEGLRVLAFGADAGRGVVSLLASAYDWLLNGSGAVMLFFVLSGYVLRLSLDRMAGSGTRIAAVFMSRRALRLFPPVFFMVAAFAVVYVTSGHRLPASVPENYTLLGLLRSALLLDYRINGVTWTLQVEAFAAPTILMLWFAQRRWGSGVLWASVLILGAMTFSGEFDRWFNRNLSFPVGFWINIYAFVAGMLVVEWRQIAVRIGVTRLSGLYPLICAAMIVAAPHIGLGNFRRIFEVLGAVGLITGIVMGLEGWVTRFLDLRVVRFYGRISYSFYLLHPLTLAVLWIDRPYVDDLVSAGVPAFVVAFIAFVVTTAVVTPLAVLSHALVEVPFVKLGKRTVGSVEARGSLP